MIIKIMGFFDIITSLVFYLFVFNNWFEPSTIIFHAIYFGVKGGVFALKDFTSKIDIIVAIYMIIVALNIFQLQQLNIIVILWILQKGVFSLISLRN